MMTVKCEENEWRDLEPEFEIMKIWQIGVNLMFQFLTRLNKNVVSIKVEKLTLQ